MVVSYKNKTMKKFSKSTFKKSKYLKKHNKKTRKNINKMKGGFPEYLKEKTKQELINNIVALTRAKKEKQLIKPQFGDYIKYQLQVGELATQKRNLISALRSKNGMTNSVTSLIAKTKENVMTNHKKHLAEMAQIKQKKVAAAAVAPPKNKMAVAQPSFKNKMTAADFSKSGKW